MNENLAVRNLKAVKDVFERFGIKFWLDGGTLLGAVRDGKILEWDLDIDLSVWSEDREKVLQALTELKKEKLDTKMQDPYYPDIGQIKLKFFPFSFGGSMDILTWQVEGNTLANVLLLDIYPPGHKSIVAMLQPLRYMRHYLCTEFGLWFPSKKAKILAEIVKYFVHRLPRRSRTVFLSMLKCRKLGSVKLFQFTPKRYFEKLGTIEFYGMTFNIPSNVEDYLKYHYGEGWKTPQKKWDWWKDDRAHPYLAT